MRCVKLKNKVKVLITVCVFLLCSCRSSEQGLFERESKKSPNVYSPGKPIKNSRTKRYERFSSKKKTRRKNAIFSGKKKRYGFIVSGAGGVKDKSAKKSYGARKSKKGRKKEK